MQGRREMCSVDFLSLITDLFAQMHHMPNIQHTDVGIKIRLLELPLLIMMVRTDLRFQGRYGMHTGGGEREVFIVV